MACSAGVETYHRATVTLRIQLRSARLSLRLLAFLVMVTAVAHVSASPGGPFAISNYAPLVQIFGLPPMPDVNVFKRKQSELSFQVDISSHFAITETDRETSIMDGESYRYTLRYSAKPHNGFQWQFAVPYVTFRGGTIDGFIDEWHKIFGLPEGGRDLNIKDRQRYFYARDGVVLLDFPDQQSGVGDILLSGQWLYQRPKYISSSTYAWTASIKLPTADETALLGSGAVDVSLGFAGNIRDKIAGYDYEWFISSAALWLGKSYFLSELQRRIVVAGGLGISVSLFPTLKFKTQLDGHSAFYSGTNIAEIGQEALQLSIGGEWNINKRWRFDFAVAEDLLIDASPDVTFHSALYAEF